MKELFNYGNSFGHLTVATLWKLESPKMTHPEDFALMFNKIFVTLRWLLLIIIIIIIITFVFAFRSLLNLFFTGVREAQGGEAVRCVLPTQGAGPVRPLRQVGRRARTRLTLSDQRLRTTCCNNYYIEL